MFPSGDTPVSSPGQKNRGTEEVSSPTVFILCIWDTRASVRAGPGLKDTQFSQTEVLPGHLELKCHHFIAPSNQQFETIHVDDVHQMFLPKRKKIEPESDGRGHVKSVVMNHLDLSGDRQLVAHTCHQFPTTLKGVMETQFTNPNYEKIKKKLKKKTQSFNNNRITNRNKK